MYETYLLSRLRERSDQSVVHKPVNTGYRLGPQHSLYPVSSLIAPGCVLTLTSLLNQSQDRSVIGNPF